MSEVKRQIPNILTILRFPLAILCAYYAITLKQTPLCISLGLFLLASITDFFDGYLARKWNIVSNFGKISDPIADKLLILSVFFVFTYHGIISMHWTLLIFLREVVLTVIRLVLMTKKIVLASRFSGKIKTVSQIGVLIAIYVFLIFKIELVQYFGTELLNSAILALVIWTVGITLYSGYEFISANRKAIEKLV